MRLCLIGVVLLLMIGCSSLASHLSENAFANETEAAVRSELGEPHHQFAGHYGLRSMDFTKQFTGEIKTLVFKKPGGEYYVSFEKRPSGWVSICSNWLPDGRAF